MVCHERYVIIFLIYTHSNLRWKEEAQLEKEVLCEVRLFGKEDHLHSWIAIMSILYSVSSYLHAC